MTPADSLLFDDALSCEEFRPATFVAGALAADAARRAAAAGEALLRALGVIEDGLRSEDAEQPADHTLQRLEAKVDLLALLVSGLADTRAGDPPRPLCWSARGARLGTADAVTPGAQGQLRVQPADWVPSPLLLPATVIACSEEQNGVRQLWVRFDPLPPGLEGALERHLFRVHRRSIAASRGPR